MSGARFEFQFGARGLDGFGGSSLLTGLHPSHRSIVLQHPAFKWVARQFRPAAHVGDASRPLP
eukprot:21255-Eustigmatos_ZCMA.PRE.1